MTDHVDVIREAFDYAQGKDVAGWGAHLRDDEVRERFAAALDALVADLEYAEVQIKDRETLGRALLAERDEARRACEKAIRERRSLEQKEDDWHSAYERAEAERDRAHTLLRRYLMSHRVLTPSGVRGCECDICLPALAALSERKETP